MSACVQVRHCTVVVAATSSELGRVAHGEAVWAESAYSDRICGGLSPSAARSFLLREATVALEADGFIMRGDARATARARRLFGR